MAIRHGVALVLLILGASSALGCYVRTGQGEPSSPHRVAAAADAGRVEPFAASPAYEPESDPAAYRSSVRPAAPGQPVAGGRSGARPPPFPSDAHQPVAPLPLPFGLGHPPFPDQANEPADEEPGEEEWTDEPPAAGEPIDEEPIDEEPPEEEPIDEEPPEEEPIDEE